MCLFITNLICFSASAKEENARQYTRESPQYEERVFDIYRGKIDIGSHVIVIERDSQNVVHTVTTTSDILLKFGFATLYYLKYKGVEEWKDGQLNSFVSYTDDNRKRKFAKIIRHSTNNILVEGMDGSKFSDVAVVPTTFWSVDNVKMNYLVDTLNGDMFFVESVFSGDEMVKTKDSQIYASKYHVGNGNYERDLWYDDRGLLVRVEFRGPHGAKLRYVMR